MDLPKGFLGNRYWNHFTGGVALVALDDGHCWAAYIGGCPEGADSEAAAIKVAAEHGYKVSKEIALAAFPHLANKPYRS